MINLSKVDKYFNKGKQNEIHVINDVTLDLPDSGMVAIFGRSGCGKTTLLNAIGGLDRFSGGTIKIGGADITEKTDDVRNRNIGYVFQNYCLNKTQTVFENVADALRLCGLKDEDEIGFRVRTALSSVGMDKYARRLPDTLSGGQQQRVAIARAIVKDPLVILADEPTGNLDESNTLMIMELLKGIAKDHLVLLVTHEENLVDHYCNIVVELADGKIVAIKENEKTLGYKAKDKNTIYLGEYEKAERKDDLVSVEYYGDALKEPIRLKIVNVNGKTYLKIDTEDVHLVDESGEIRLQDGVFEEMPKEKDENKSEESPSIPPLKVDSEAKTGKLFSFKSAVKSGFNVYFLNRKRGRKLLQAAMIVFAIIFTFLTATSATSIRSLITANNSFHHNVFYVCTPDEDISNLITNAAASENSSIDYLRVTDYSYAAGGTETVRVNMGQFETLRSGNSIVSNAVKLDTALSQNKTAVVGKSAANDGEVIITTAVADSMIEGETMPLVTEYSDFIGLIIPRRQYDLNSRGLRIAGVVRSDEFSIYLSSRDLFIESLRSLQIAAMPSSLVSDLIDVSSVSAGRALLLGVSESVYDELFINLISEGESLKITGKSITVAQKTAVRDMGLADEIRQRFYKYDFAFPNNYVFILSDADCKEITSKVGKTDNRAKEYYPYNYDEDYYGLYGYPSAYYTLIHSTDPDKTEKYLLNVLSGYSFDGLAFDASPLILSPSFFHGEIIESILTEVVSSLSGLVVMLVLLSISMYFIMRSALMGRVREIGIYRAIGVKKKNIIFRFFVESLVLTTFTVFIGYLISDLLLYYMLASSPFISLVFYYPVWMAFAVLAVIYAVCTFSGTLPVTMLLKKTPSEILSKYDI